ncbi:retrovirus-related pol polyprotein from transposon TNT 1-94 [Tanacetum coccineum]
MKLSEVKKFCDGTLIKICKNLVDMVKRNKLGTGNKRLKVIDWNDMDVKKLNEMVDKIDKVLKCREQLRRIEEYVGGRPKTMTKQERESMIYDEFDKFTSDHGESIHSYYLRYAKLINDMKMIPMSMSNMEINMKFVNHLQPEWSRFVTVAKQERDLHSVNFDKLYAFLKHNEKDAKEVREMRQRFPEPLALLANTYNPPPSYSSQQIHSTNNSRYPPTNNQLRTSSNPRTHAIIQDGQVTIQNVQGKQSQGYAGNAGKNQTTGARVVNPVGNVGENQPRVIICYNCNGEGHITKQCTAKKRVKDSEWFKDKMLLAQLQATTNFKANHVDAYDSNCDDKATSNEIFMANLSPVGSINDDTVEPRYDSDILSKVPHYNTYHDSNMLNSNIQELGYIENIVSNNESYDELTSNNNVISYTDYMHTIGNDDDNYVPPHVQKNDMMLSVIEQMKSQVEKCNMVNQESQSVNVSLTSELERYKDRVRILEYAAKDGCSEKEAWLEQQLYWSSTPSPPGNVLKPTKVFPKTLPSTSQVLKNLNNARDLLSSKPKTSQARPKRIAYTPSRRNKTLHIPSETSKLSEILHQISISVPRAWYDELSNFLVSKGFSKGSIVPTLFNTKKREDILLVQIYVDDIIFGSTNLKLSKRFEKLMDKKFEMSMMGELKFFLGIQIHQSPRGIFINQAKYAQEIFKKHGMTTCDSVGTPMATKPLDADLSGTLVDQTKYRSMVRALMYLTANSDHAGCLNTRKSTSGGIQFLGGDKLVSWSLKKQDCTSMSSVEAEYVSLSACCTQVLWLRTYLTDYGFHFDKIPMYCDSKATIAISCNPVQHFRTKHIDLADLFTKALPEDRFKYLVRRLGMRCLTPEELEVLANESA